MNKNHKILHIAVEAGRIMLQNGGETYRAEETMRRICYAFNISEADGFVTPTGIMLSITDKNGETYTLIKRIQNRTVNLEKISIINDLSRSVASKRLTLNYVEYKLKHIEQISAFSCKFLVITASLAAGFFTLLFGGNFNDFIVSLVIGAFVKILVIILNKLETNEFFINALGGAATSLIALIGVRLNIGNNQDKIIIGSIMLLVPGLLITNAIRDTIAGDLMSGLTRAVEAFFIAIAIAIGSGLIIKLWSIFFGGILT